MFSVVFVWLCFLIGLVNLIACPFKLLKKIYNGGFELGRIGNGSGRRTNGTDGEPDGADGTSREFHRDDKPCICDIYDNTAGNDYYNNQQS